jgi:hypothetical protein
MLVVLVAALLLTAAGPAFGAFKVRVRGSVSIEARAIPRGDTLEVRGSLKDDVGRPLGQARLRARFQRERGGPLVPMTSPRPCKPTRTRDLYHTWGELVIDTDGTGAFCFSLSDAKRRGVVELEFDGDRDYDKAETSVDVDSSRRSLLLSFLRLGALPLESESHAITVSTGVDPPEEASSEPLQLRLVLEERDGKRRDLAKATTQAGESAEFRVAARALGQPGPATLWVEFAGSDTIQPAKKSGLITRTARVTLSPAGTLPTADPSDGVELNVAVGSALGAVPGGAVEGVVNGESVGAAPVSMGIAHVAMWFPLPTHGVIPVTLRYLPEAPWWVAGEPLSLSLPVAPPSPWRRVPWVIAAIGIAFWVVRTWWRPTRTEKPERDRVSVPPGRPSLDVVEVGPLRSGWKGRVLDAHDGTAIAGARISVMVPSFGGDGVGASDVADDDGAFTLSHVESGEGARLEVTARYHSTLIRPLPPAGNVVVSLVSRRRSLLGRLVDWAGRMGRPWTLPGEPTPGHVAKVAAARRAADVEGWAEAVEAAAYGPETPDAEAEERIREREPSWRGREEAGRSDVDGPKRPSL